MKRSLWIWIAVFVISVGAFVGLNLEDLRHRIMIARTSADVPESTSLPFRLERGLVVVTTELNGRPVEMIVDTAAFETRLSSGTARDSGIEAVIGDDVGDTFGRTQQMGIAVLPEWRVEAATWNRATAGILQWGEGALTPCVAPDGIIGGTTMKHASWAFDFASSTLHVGRPDELPSSFDADLVSVRLPIKRSRIALEPQIEGRVNGTVVDGLLLDTGSNGGLVLPRRMIEELAIPQSEWIAVDDAARAGIFGVTEIEAVLAPVELSLGHTEPLEVLATFTDGSEPKIGNEVLSRYAFAILPERRELHLGLRTDIAQGPVGRPLSHGMLPGIVEGEDVWEVVYRERPWSDARDAETVDPLAVGTRIATINGLRPSQVYASPYEWFLGVRDFMDQRELVLGDPIKN